MTLAVENHDRYSVAELASLIHGLGDWAGICLDTVNSFGALEGPAIVLETLAPLAVNLHIKDFAVRRLDHAMGFAIEGRPVGAGQLDVPAVLTLLEQYRRVDTGVIELWTPPEATINATIDKEAQWATESLDYLRHSAGMTD